MAKIAPALQKLIADGTVKPPSAVNLDFVSRRQRLNWLVANPQSISSTIYVRLQPAPKAAMVQTYRTVVASTERMNDRAAMGLSFDEKAMAKVARPQKVQPKPVKVQPKPVKVRAKKAPVVKPAKVATPKATKKTKAAAVPKVAQAVPNAASIPSLVARVIFLIDRSPSMLYPASMHNDEVERLHRSVGPGGQVGVKRYELVDKQIADIIRAMSPDFLVDVFDFDGYSQLIWSGVKAGSLVSSGRLPQHPISRQTGGTAIYTALEEGLRRAESYVAAQVPTLLYLLTDGDNNGRTLDLRAMTKRLLATGRFTIAAIGPKTALSFLPSLGIDSGSIRDWQGDAEEMKVATEQAVKGAERFTAAVQAGKTKLDSFFVDVVAQSVTVEKAKKQLRDLKALLRVRKISSFVAVEKFVTDELKLTYVPGAAYYQLQNATELKQGRRIILQPRGQDCYLSGPDVRALLGLPDDRDIKLEPKNLGDFVVYVQSASTTRKLLPGTQFLYDESHVAGATAPTWSYAAPANGGGSSQGNGTAGKGN